MNNHLLKLYLELDFLYKNIISVCVGCQDHDCEGYVWLLEEEASALYNLNIPVVEINENIFFIHSFEEVDGVLSIEKPKPPCRLRQSGFCSIHDSRPLVCRLYPIGLATIKNEVLVVLHQDCKFSRDIAGEAKAIFLAQAIEILKQTPDNLLSEIMETYKKVDAISTFPDGPNAFEVIMSLGSLIKERR